MKKGFLKKSHLNTIGSLYIFQGMHIFFKFLYWQVCVRDSFGGRTAGSTPQGPRCRVQAAKAAAGEP
jgi:hypothetical protein